MSEHIWYIYQQSQQTGPFDLPKIMEMLTNNMISQDAYLFKVGWKEWRPIEECQAELNGPDLPSPEIQAPEETKQRERQDRAPRATIKGRVIVHNNGQLVIGSGVNISATGIFVETQDKIFEIGEELKLTCRVDGTPKAFNVTAKVMRFNEGGKFPIGYGLMFITLDQHVAQELQRLIDQANQVMGGD